jgi:hypothetical protein
MSGKPRESNITAYKDEEASFIAEGIGEYRE